MAKGKAECRRVVIALQMAGRPGQRKLSGALDYFAEAGINCRFRFVRHRDAFTPEFIRSLGRNDVHGILYSFDTVPTVEAELAKIDIPTVGIDVFDQSPLCGRTRNLAFVTGDCEEVGRAAADLLMDSGKFRSFAFVPDLRNAPWSRLRGHAFVSLLKMHGFRADVYHRSRDNAYDIAELSAWLKRQLKPCGVFVAFDDRALDVVDACNMAGLRIPEDVAIVGVDNDETLCEHTDSPLTSIQPDHVAEGRLAAKLLCEMMKGRTTETVRREMCGVAQIVVRESTPTVSNAGRLVQRAVAYIQENATKGIEVSDVVAHLKCSRRLADLRFRELQGMSILEAIRKVQMDEVCRLLRTTNMSGAAIAAQAGFLSAKHLPERFKAMFGCTMGAFRKSKTGT